MFIQIKRTQLGTQEKQTIYFLVEACLQLYYSFSLQAREGQLTLISHNLSMNLIILITKPFNTQVQHVTFGPLNLLILATLIHKAHNNFPVFMKRGLNSHAVQCPATWEITERSLESYLERSPMNMIHNILMRSLSSIYCNF